MFGRIINRPPHCAMWARASMPAKDDFRREQRLNGGGRLRANGAANSELLFGSEQRGSTMASTRKKAKNEIARYASGSRDDTAVDKKIAQAWSGLLNTQRDEIAKLLGVPATALDPAKPPFRAETQAGGITGVEIAIILATGFATGFAEDLGSAAGKAAAKKLRELWSRYMAKQVSTPKDPALGKRIDEDT
jgi:hypothetical protein